MNKLLILIIAMLLLMSAVSATINIEPEWLEFNDVLDSREYTKIITVSSDSNSNILVTADMPKSLEGVVEIEPVKRIINNELPLHIRVTAKAKEVDDHISFCFNNLDGSMISTEGEVCTGIRVIVKLGSQEIKNAIVKDVKVHDAEPDGLMDIQINVENLGNVDIKPVINVAGTALNFESKAQQNQEIHMSLPHSFDLGKHKANVEIEFDGKELYDKDVEFNIREHLSNKISLHVLPIADSVVNETLRLYALVENRGESPVEGKVEIEILNNEEVLQRFESDEFLGVTEVKEKRFEFVPSVHGEYVVKGRVSYSDTYTDTIEQRFNAVDSADAVGLSFGYVGFLLLFIVLFVYLQKKYKFVKKPKKK